MEQTRICEKEFGSREVQFIWHELPGASTRDIKK